MCHSSVGSVCIQAYSRKGFLSERPLFQKTVVKALVDSYVEGLHSIFTDIFSLSVKCEDYDFLQFSITHDKV